MSTACAQFVCEIYAGDISLSGLTQAECRATITNGHPVDWPVPNGKELS